MASQILETRASSLAVSRSRKTAIERCSGSVGIAVTIEWMSFLYTPGTADFSPLTTNNGDRCPSIPSMYQRNVGSLFLRCMLYSVVFRGQ